MTAQSQRPQAVVYDETKFPDAPMAAVRYFLQVIEAKGERHAQLLRAFAFLCNFTAEAVPDNLDAVASQHMGEISEALGMDVQEVGTMIGCTMTDIDTLSLRRQLSGQTH